MGITVQANGSFTNTQKLLLRLNKQQITAILESYGPAGVTALQAATPVGTGETANSWFYEVNVKGSSYEIVWKNSHIVNGANIALLIQYGHGTGTGGFVQGRDYINPAMAPIFQQILDEVRKVVKT